ncbi:MAG: CRISPR-associated endonuclease Cas3'', partial [Bacteroidales bacterium]|nr:CRISPR-associated endonuclease Cas3'' [Bacteroidales bacterium]
MQDTKIPKYISHIRKNQYDEIISYQSNEEHCIGVAELAKQFASEFGMGNWGYVLGILHDKGKEKKEFQEYIQDVNGIPGHKHWTKKGKAHAYVGALLAQGLYGKVATIFFGNAICGHHAGLYDFFELEKMISSSDLPSEVQMQTDAIQLNKAKFTLTENQINHLVRVLFSCLVDADYLDTEKFMNVSSASQRGHHKKLSELLILLEDHFCKLNNNSEDSTVNVIRRCVQEQCIKMSSGENGFYSLTVPTGGGKTLSSLLWAMRHAVCNGQKRIIIAIPYTSIIVQTASVLKSIFGEENVLEHHSQFTIDSIIDKDIRLKAKLASENWDYPIIVTTNVQLFESMFSNKPSDCRKLHNIANSVIILDEVQTLPTDYLQPIVDALKSYQRMFGISVLFTTASQPVLSGLIEGCNPKAAFQGIDGITEIIPKEYALHDRLRRVCLEIDNTGSTYDEIADRLSRHDKVLCIVNNRNDAREIFERLPKEGMTFHLSRMMCPRHVTKAI